MMSGRSSTISIVMPVRNAAATLDAAIGSIRAQTLDSWELIIVDDGSTDGGLRQAEDHARVDPRIRVLSTPPRGIVSALIDGCAAATTPVIARMDADDLMRPRRLQRQWEFLDRHHGVDVVGTQVDFGGDPERAAGLAAYIEWSNGLLTSEQIRLARFVEAPVIHPTVAFRRSLIDSVGGYRETGEAEDYELWLRWMEAGVEFGKVPERLLVWNDPPTRLTRTDPHYATTQHARLRCRYLSAQLRSRDERRAIWLWGAGRVTRRRFDDLAAHGVTISGFVDIDPRKIGQRIDDRPVVAPEKIPPPSEVFVIAGVSARGAGTLIRDRLLAQGRREGTDFLLAG